MKTFWQLSVPVTQSVYKTFLCDSSEITVSNFFLPASGCTSD